MTQLQSDYSDLVPKNLQRGSGCGHTTSLPVIASDHWPRLTTELSMQFSGQTLLNVNPRYEDRRQLLCWIQCQTVCLNVFDHGHGSEEGCA